MGDSSMKDRSLFREELIFLDIPFRTSSEVLDYASAELLKLGYVREGFNKAVKLREKKYPTGLPYALYNIAIPHTDPEYIIKPFIAVVRPAAEVPFVQMATADTVLGVKLIFVLGLNKGEDQIKALQALIETFLEGKVSQGFLLAKDAKECMDLLDVIQKSIRD